MTVRPRSWWQKILQHRGTIAVTTAIIVTAVVLIIVGYRFDLTGFNGYIQVSIIRTLSGPTAGTVNRTEVFQPGKTLWDWLQLLIIPIVLAAAGFAINFTSSNNEQKSTQLRDLTEREIALDNQREAALQEYIDKMSELLLHEKLRESQLGDEVRSIARVRTLSILSRLDDIRKGSVVLFLYESKLIDGDKSIIILSGADLSKVMLGTKAGEIMPGRANLSGAYLIKADLGGANLSGADLSGAIMYKAKLWGANLTRANLYQTRLSNAMLAAVDLTETNLRETDLESAFLEGANLSQANLTGANLFRAMLRLANLKDTNLNKASLHQAYLQDAKLVGADLSGASLYVADLTRADLTGAKVSNKQLSEAESLRNATMPDGSKHL